MKSFDRKFGNEFLAQLPNTPGVYLFYSEDETVIYVGKAKNLRRRLAQYRNAKRRKKHRKMKYIVRDAVRLEIQTCNSDLNASILEMRLIQKLRPRWNVAGAFYFLYPLIGLKQKGDEVVFCYTRDPEAFKDFSLHGAFRSREITGNAFFALMRLLTYIGHLSEKNKISSGSYLYRFRQLPVEWIEEFDLFFKGEKKNALETLTLGLLENAGARKAAPKIQELLNELTRFWRHEATKLARVRKKVGHFEYPVQQAERDVVFLKSGQWNNI